MPTNLDLAPPARIVDGLHAVAIDIQHVVARLTFDGATGTGAGDATLTFVTGPEAGAPIFDLRQPITAAWLDGVAVPPAQMVHHDFGGGPNAQLRVLERTLPPATSHTLRITYELGPPQASSAGSYQPQMQWSGGRLAFNLGFTDLGAGRYLESWVPSNLIFDQFSMDLEVRLNNTDIPHSVITNGEVTPVGPGGWRISYPASFTALSPMLEVRATDTLDRMTGSVVLPVSGRTVTIEAWKLRISSADLATEIANISSWLIENETDVGPYLHGSRFVAFVHVGGMEYSGATTSAPSALRHEVFHSWWARGLKPASQPDAWWDEAWTVYSLAGGAASQPFDFTNPPVELCTRNPWSRVTPSTAYTLGRDFFAGAAALIGAPRLRTLMNSFYRVRSARPATTPDLEGFLISRSGSAGLVDGFHRFVYGFADQPVDLWLRDDVSHTGVEHWGGRFWDSPDLWVRNADDGGRVHQAPEYGKDNWIYARVRNRGVSTASHFVVVFNVKPFAGVEFEYPSDYLPGVAAVAGFGLAPGSSTVVKARWPRSRVPPPGAHACLLAAVIARGEHPTPGSNVWEQNGLAQKNLTIVDLQPDAWFVLPFVLDRVPIRNGRSFRLELARPPDAEKLEAVLLHTSGAIFPPGRDVRHALTAPSRGAPMHGPVDHLVAAPTSDRARSVWTSANPGAVLASRMEHAVEMAFDPGRVSTVSLREGIGPFFLGLRLHVPPGAKEGDRYTIDLIRRSDEGRIVGGLAVLMRISSHGA